MYHFIVCEEDPKVAEYLVSCLQARYPDAEIIRYANNEQLFLNSSLLPKEGILFIEGNDKDDRTRAILQDIAMKHPSIIFVFITDCVNQNSANAVRSYWIYRPELVNHLNLAMERAVLHLDERKTKVCLPQKDSVIVMKSNDIICLERDRRKTHITGEDQSYSVSWNLEQLLTKLPSNFILCHRSYIVNLDKVKIYKRTEFLMKNDLCIPIGRSFTRTVRKQFLAFMQHDKNDDIN